MFRYDHIFSQRTNLQRVSSLTYRIRGAINAILRHYFNKIIKLLILCHVVVQTPRGSKLA